MTAGWHHRWQRQEIQCHLSENTTCAIRLAKCLCVCVCVCVNTRCLCQWESGPVSAGTDRHGIRIFRFSESQSSHSFSLPVQQYSDIVELQKLPSEMHCVLVHRRECYTEYKTRKIRKERGITTVCVFSCLRPECMLAIVDNALCSHRIHLRQSHRLRQLFYSPALTEDSPTCSLNALSYLLYSANATDPLRQQSSWLPPSSPNV